jgi:hypothetical protein
MMTVNKHLPKENLSKIDICRMPFKVVMQLCRFLTYICSQLINILLEAFVQIFLSQTKLNTQTESTEKLLITIPSNVVEIDNYFTSCQFDFQNNRWNL